MSDRDVLTAGDMDAAALILRLRAADVQRMLEEMAPTITEETAKQLIKYQCDLSLLSFKFTVFASQIQAEMIPPPRMKS